MANGGFDIRLIGGRKLNRMLKELPSRAQRKVIRKAMTVAGRVIRDAVRKRTPVRTGRLKKSIKSRTPQSLGQKPKRGTIKRLVAVGTRAELGIAPDDRHFWPSALEFGHGNVPPKSYMRAGFDSSENSAQAVLRREIAAGIEREAQRLAR